MRIYALESIRNLKFSRTFGTVVWNKKTFVIFLNKRKVEERYLRFSIWQRHLGAGKQCGWKSDLFDFLFGTWTLLYDRLCPLMLIFSESSKWEYIEKRAWQATAKREITSKVKYLRTMGSNIRETCLYLYVVWVRTSYGSTFLVCFLVFAFWNILNSKFRS